MASPVITPTPSMAPASPTAGPVSPSPSPSASSADLLASTLAPFMTPDGPATEPPRLNIPGTESPAAAETPGQVQAEAAPEGSQEEEETPESESPEDLSAPPSGLDTNSTRGQMIWADHRMMAQLEKPEAEGGIGFKPSVDQIRGWMGSSRSWDNFTMDLQSGDPQKVGFVAQYLLQRAPESVPHLIDAIQQGNPDLAQSFHDQAIGKEVQAILNIARSQADQGAKDYWFQVANGLNYASTGRPLDAGEMAKPYQPPAKPGGPANSLEERERRVQAQERQALKATLDNWYGGLRTDIDSTMNAIIDPILAQTSLSPEIRAIVAKDLRERVMKSVDETSFLKDAQEMEFRRVGQSGGDARILQDAKARLIAIYQRQTQPVVAREAKILIRRSQPMAAKVAAAAAADAKLSSMKGDTAPAGPPNPATPSNANGSLPARSRGETDIDWMNRVMGGIFRQ